ncbi:MAG: hypothetical protein RSD49_18290 [Hafnia sp.]
MLNIGTTVEHNLPNDWTGIEIVEPNPSFATAFKKGMVIILSEKTGVRGLSYSLEFAHKVTQSLGANKQMHFPFTPDDEFRAFSIELEMSEAVQLAQLTDSNLWLRPVSRIGSGGALCIDSGHFNQVPGPRGGYPASMPSASEMIGRWQVCAPEVALIENDINLKALA